MSLLDNLRTKPASRGRRVTVHGSQEWLRAIAAEEQEFFSKLAPHLVKNGVRMDTVLEGSKAAAAAFDDPNCLNLLINHPPAYGPRILHVNPAPILGFWHVDEVGPAQHSSLRLSEFDPTHVDADKATYFFNGVAGYMIRENVSPIRQADRAHNGLHSARAVVFCGADDGTVPTLSYLNHETMIRTCAEQDRNALIYVKLHADQGKENRRLVMDVCRDYQNVKISEASLHDLIEASDLVVTQNAPAGFEALMHKRPVITCAKSSYWHASLTARNRSDLKQALEFGADLMADFPYEKYFFWTLVRHGLEPAKDDFAKRAWARLRDKVLW